MDWTRIGHQFGADWPLIETGFSAALEGFRTAELLPFDRAQGPWLAARKDGTGYDLRVIVCRQDWPTRLTG